MKPSTLVTTTFVTAVAAAAALAASHSFEGLMAGLRPTANAAQAPPATTPSAAAPSDGICGLRDGAFTGKVADAYYGPMQVRALVKSGCLASVDVLQFPADRPASRRINSQALPILQDEVVHAQSRGVDVVTGATLSSEAYIASLADALQQAKS